MYSGEYIDGKRDDKPEDVMYEGKPCKFYSRDPNVKD